MAKEKKSKPKEGDAVRLDGKDYEIQGFRLDGATARLTRADEDVSCAVAELTWDEAGFWYLPGRK